MYLRKLKEADLSVRQKNVPLSCKLDNLQHTFMHYDHKN